TAGDEGDHVAGRPFPGTASAEGAQFNVPPSPRLRVPASLLGAGTLSEDAPHWHIDPGAHLVRRRHWLCLADVFRRHLAHTGEACQAHGTDEFILHDLQHAHNAVLTTSGEAPRLHSTKGDHVGA